jgi:hypothetical protein
MRALIISTFLSAGVRKAPTERDNKAEGVRVDIRGSLNCLPPPGNSGRSRKPEVAWAGKNVKFDERTERRPGGRKCTDDFWRLRLSQKSGTARHLTTWPDLEQARPTKAGA